MHYSGPPSTSFLPGAGPAGDLPGGVFGLPAEAIPAEPHVLEAQLPQTQPATLRRVPSAWRRALDFFRRRFTARDPHAAGDDYFTAGPAYTLNRK